MMLPRHPAAEEGGESYALGIECDTYSDGSGGGVRGSARGDAHVGTAGFERRRRRRCWQFEWRTGSSHGHCASSVLCTTEDVDLVSQLSDCMLRWKRKGRMVDKPVGWLAFWRSGFNGGGIAHHDRGRGRALPWRRHIFTPSNPDDSEF